MRNTAVIIAAMFVSAGVAFWAGTHFRERRATRILNQTLVFPTVMTNAAATKGAIAAPAAPAAGTVPRGADFRRVAGEMISNRAANATPGHIENPERGERSAAAGEPSGVDYRVVQFPAPAYEGLPDQTLVGFYDPRTEPRFRIPAGDLLLSLRKPVTASDSAPRIGNLGMITDGDVRAMEGSYVELAGGPQHVTIDLQATSVIDAIIVWHYSIQPRVYRDVVVQISESNAFTKAVTVFNNDRKNQLGLGAGIDEEYLETFVGLPIELDGVRGRYVRLYSNGNTANSMNDYTEVSVFGHAEALQR